MSWSMGLPKWHCETQEKTWENFDSYATHVRWHSPTVEHIPPDDSKPVTNFLEYQEKQEKLEFWFL